MAENKKGMGCCGIVAVVIAVALCAKAYLPERPAQPAIQEKQDESEGRLSWHLKYLGPPDADVTEKKNGVEVRHLTYRAGRIRFAFVKSTNPMPKTPEDAWELLACLDLDTGEFITGNEIVRRIGLITDYRINRP